MDIAAVSQETIHARDICERGGGGVGEKREENDSAGARARGERERRMRSRDRSLANIPGNATRVCDDERRPRLVHALFGALSLSSRSGTHKCPFFYSPRRPRDDTHSRAFVRGARGLGCYNFGRCGRKGNILYLLVILFLRRSCFRSTGLKNPVI